MTYLQNEVQGSLSRIPYFKSVAEEDLASLAKLATKRYFKKGDLIFTQDQRCRHLHIVHSGKIKIFIISETGRE
jgi:CRP/FNR family transcriptional regulator